MRTAIYNDNIINALDSKNKYGNYIHNVYKEYKIAGQEGHIICPVDMEDYKQVAYVFRAYCYNATWNQIDLGEIGIVPFENTIIRVW